MTAHEIHALSGAYAMDALDDLERARFEAHLAECAECRAEVASLQDAAAMLPALTETAPPPAMREKLLAEIKTVRPLPPITELGRRRPRWVNAVAGVAAAGLFFGGGAVVWQQTHDETVQVNLADSVIQARDARHVTLDLPGGASATVYRSVSQDRAALVTRDMKAAPEGRVYQLWLQKGGRMISAGLMKQAGDQALLLHGHANSATAVGITVEPAGGSAEPTTAPVAIFEFERAT